VAAAGALEFRIGPAHPEIYPGRSLLDARLDEYRAAVREFDEHGPQRARRRNAALRWFPIHGANKRVGARLVTREHQGRGYVLLFDEPDKTMLAPQPGEDGPGWSLTRAYPTADTMGRPAVGFELDEAGARRMAELTSKFENHAMAILLDDEVYSAPYVRATIRNRGIIEGSFTPREVNELVGLLQVGSLPARLNPEPVSQRSFGPAKGPD
jgi:preprotein translocase subunit SecD